MHDDCTECEHLFKRAEEKKMKTVRYEMTAQNM